MGFFGAIAPVLGQIGGSMMAGPMGGALGGALGSAIGGEMGGNKNFENPYNAASPSIAQIPEVAKKYYNPFIERGNQARETLPGLFDYGENIYRNPNTPNYREMPVNYNTMANDPQAFINAMQSGYSPSEGYKFKQEQMLKAMRNSAAQGGMSGTRSAGLEQARGVQGLLGEDMQQYLQNVLGVNQQGTAGIERMLERYQGGEQNRMAGLSNALNQRIGHTMGQEGMGYESNNNLVDALMKTLTAQAGLGFGSQNARNEFDRGRQGQQQQNFGGVGQALSGMMPQGAPWGQRSPIPGANPGTNNIRVGSNGVWRV